MPPSHARAGVGDIDMSTRKKPSLRQLQKINQAAETNTNSNRPEGETNSLHLLAGAAVAATLDPAISGHIAGGSVAALIHVPSPAWFDPTMYIMAELFPCAEVIRLKGRFDADDSGIAETLSMGRSLIAIYVHDKFIPAALKNCADIRLSVTSPTGADLARVIAEINGGRRPSVPQDFGEGLDLLTLACAIRPGGGTKASVRRISEIQNLPTLVASCTDAPPLSVLDGYGPAMDWANGVVADVAAYRRGEVKWSDLVATTRVLLASEPGMGKTSLMRSLSRTLDVPLIATSVGAWFTTKNDSHLGKIIEAAEESHRQAVKAAEAFGVAIWFLDELDALPNRDDLVGRGRDFWTPLITRMLTLIDGAVAMPGVIVVGATNLAHRIDPALQRPGRLNNVITIPRPDVHAIAGILAVHVGDDLSRADIDRVAKLGLGKTGAGLAACVQQARAVARRQRRAMTAEDLAAVLAPSHGTDDALLRRIAVHEAGHALIAHSVGIVVHEISILKSDFGLGYVRSRVNSVTRADIERQIAIGLAGRAAEEIVFGEPSVGAGADLVEATRKMTALHINLGMCERLVAVETPPDEALQADPKLRDQVEADLRGIYFNVSDTLKHQRLTLDRISKALLDQRVLTGDHFLALVDPGRSTPRSRRKLARV